MSDEYGQIIQLPGGGYEWQRGSNEKALKRATLLEAADLLEQKTLERADPLGLKECFHDWDRCSPEEAKKAIVKWLRKIASE